MALDFGWTPAQLRSMTPRDRHMIVAVSNARGEAIEFHRKGKK